MGKHTAMAKRSCSCTTSLGFSAAVPSFIFFFLLISPSSSSSSAAADHDLSDETTSISAATAWPLSLSDLWPNALESAAAIPDLALDLITDPTPLSQPADHVEGQRQHQEPRQLQGAPLSQAKGSGVGRRGKCSYTVSIKTSCSSPRITRDAVGITFGDVYRNEVYVARLDDPSSGTFERCSVDTFRIMGPCGERTCYLYLRRSGRDGWTPESVKVFYSPSEPRAAVTFFYKVPLPNGVWYGFNLCHGAAFAVPMPSTTLNQRHATG